MIEPERFARTVVLLGATASAFAPLALHAVAERRTANLAVGVVLLLLACLSALRAEASPEDLDSEGARRARRFAPLAVGVCLAFLPAFPVYFDWGWVALLFFADLPLVFFWYVPGVRAISLVLATTAALAGVVLVPDDAAWPCLLPVGLAWTVVPALDRLVAVRSQLDPRPPARVGAAFKPAALVLAVALALGVAAAAIAPGSTRSWDKDRSFFRAAAGKPREIPPLPLGKLALLAAATAISLALWNIYSERRGGRLAPLTERGAMAMDAARPLDPEQVERGVERWPPGPRRDLVTAYLRHLIVLDGQGLRRPPGRTPDDHARAIGARHELVAADAERLADAFDRARWGGAPITAQEAARAAEQAREIEAAAERKGS